MKYTYTRWLLVKLSELGVITYKPQIKRWGDSDVTELTYYLCKWCKSREISELMELYYIRVKSKVSKLSYRAA